MKISKLLVQALSSIGFKKSQELQYLDIPTIPDTVDALYKNLKDRQLAQYLIEFSVKTDFNFVMLPGLTPDQIKSLMSELPKLGDELGSLRTTLKKGNGFGSYQTSAQAKWPDDVTEYRAEKVEWQRHFKGICLNNHSGEDHILSEQLLRSLPNTIRQSSVSGKATETAETGTFVKPIFIGNKLHHKFGIGTKVQTDILPDYYLTAAEVDDGIHALDTPNLHLGRDV